VVESLGGRGFKADLLEEARALAKQTLGDAANELQIQSEILRLLSNAQGIVFGTAELKADRF